MLKMVNGYEFYLSNLLLPVTPSKFQMKIKNLNKTVILVNNGEINLLKKAGLTDISFVAEFPNVKYPYARYKDGFQNAGYFIEQLEKLKTDTDAKGKLKPFPFIVSRTLPSGKRLFDNTESVKVSLEDYKFVEESSNGLDVKVEISLKLYRNYSTKTIRLEQSNQNELPEAVIEQERPAENAPKAKTYTVVRNDSLWAIAKSQLGNGNRYPEIYALNQELIDGRNKGSGLPKHTIYPGQIFTLPL